MSSLHPITIRHEHAPTVDCLEADADRVTGELGRVMDAAREIFRRLQDVEAEHDPDDPDSGGGAAAVRHKLLYDLRVMRRQMERAQAILVPVDDPRRGPAAQALGWLDEADREDRPWSVKAA